MASLWQAPILYVLENNHIAQTTPAAQAVAGDIGARFLAFDIPVSELDTSDVLEISDQAKQLLEEIRTGQGPRALIIHTHRFGPHSKGDDTRDPDVIAQLRKNRDPLEIQAKRIPPENRAVIEAEVAAQVAAAYRQAFEEPYPQI